MVFILGEIISTYLFSGLISLMALRNVQRPKRQLYSVSITWFVLTCITAYVMADSEEHDFIFAALNIGVASIIVMAIYLIFHVPAKIKQSTVQIIKNQKIDIDALLELYEIG